MSQGWVDDPRVLPAQLARLRKQVDNTNRLREGVHDEEKAIRLIGVLGMLDAVYLAYISDEQLQSMMSDPDGAIKWAEGELQKRRDMNAQEHSRE